MSQQEELTGVLQRYFEIIKTPHTEPAKEFLRLCQSYSVRMNDRVYKYYQRGSGPIILLVHGIHSNLGAMVAIAEDLLDEGYRVALFDIPAHGEAAGETTDPVEVREFIRKIVSRLGEIHAVVCHSLGGLWALTAMHNGFSAKKFVSIASPSDKKFIVDKFAQLHQINDDMVKRLMKELENRFGASMWAEFSPSEIVKTIAMPGLIIHGKNDDFVPPVHAERLQSNWREAQVEMVDGVGHFDIVGSPKVRRLVTAYLLEA